MGKPVLILGKSGLGKSASMRNFPDDKYSLVEVQGKPLPFKSSKKFYTCDKAPQIINYLKNPKVKDSIVIDDSQYIMANEYMREAKTKGYEKYTNIGKSFWEVINAIKDLPDNKIVYFLHHIESDKMGGWKIKTIGNMLDEKICIEGMFTIVLRSLKTTDGVYGFSTQSDGTDPIKTPIDMFSDSFIDNDLYMVDTTIREFYDILPEPKKKQQLVPTNQQDMESKAFGKSPLTPDKQLSVSRKLFDLLHTQLADGSVCFTSGQIENFIRMLGNSSEEWVCLQVQNAIDATKANRQKNTEQTTSLFKGEWKK